VPVRFRLTSLARQGVAGRGRAGRGRAGRGKAWATTHKGDEMKTYAVTIRGLSDMLHHQDNIEWSGQMQHWREDPKNKAKSVRGDDRSPACTWIGGLYHDGKHVAIPADNLMRCLMVGGAQVMVPGGKNGKTFKAQTQSGMLVVEEFWPLFVSEKPIPVERILALVNEEDFAVHVETVKKAGFMLHVKRAKIGASKHVRVRPRFSSWSARGTLQVWDDQLKLPALVDILRMAGSNKGLGDWRPSSRTPGPFGRFESEIVEIK
jgi:hypothetical protein